MKKFKCVLLLCLSMVLFAGCSLDHVTMDNLQDKLKSEANVSTKEIGINVELLGVDDLEDAYLLEDSHGNDLVVGKLADDSKITSKNINDTDVEKVVGSDCIVQNGYVYKLSTSFTNYDKCKKVLEKLGD